jgi:ferredoxin
MSLEVRVDRARCIGTKSCTYAAEHTFRLDQGGISTVVDPCGDPEEDVVAAAESCPTGAISVFKAGTRIA